ncbi:unnamed protein product [Pelagomonas calceolata]|uniref:Fe2OG dioxygenase domain-containing protein n=2 Tax=Pelagomonas calceolata TaxID=35677 RepID=A0A8J2WQ89_9STRA|nr:unnamed protein product [Pelagomonas calceolata]
MSDAITNDPELERKGCAAAAEYAQIHWAKLQRLVNDDAVPAESIELHGNDRRLYACFRASISEDVAVLRAEQLKTRIWRDLLTCMDGRVKDHNFMTLLRPDAALSYDDQRENLFVVPRAQFLMIELARQREGCYDGAWRAKRRACAMPASAPLRLTRTTRYSVLECAASTARIVGVDASSSAADASATSATAEGAEEESDNARAARLGKQLAECVPCAEAARRLPCPRTAARRPRDGAPVVIDGALDQAACAEACAAALAFFDGAGDRRIAEQQLHRGDDVAFVPLFGEDEGSPLRQALGPARRLLARAAADIGDADLLVPEVAQLALYDGCKRNLKPGYVAHRDNASTPGAAGENYREVTLLLYLNGAPPGASGGELRSYVGAEPSDLDGATALRVDDIQPRAGRLVLFESRTLLHAVRPVGLWRRVALSLWCLKRIPNDRLSPLTDILGADAFQYLDAISLARLAACARVFGKKKDGRSLCDAAARQQLSALREEFLTGVKSIDGMDWLLYRQIPSWIYCLYDWEESSAALGRWGPVDMFGDRGWTFRRKEKEREKRKRAVDEIRHQIHIKGSRAQEYVDDFLAELLRDAREED